MIEIFLGFTLEERDTMGVRERDDSGLLTDLHVVKFWCEIVEEGFCEEHETEWK